MAVIIGPGMKKALKEAGIEIELTLDQKIEDLIKELAAEEKISEALGGCYEYHEGRAEAYGVIIAKLKKIIGGIKC
jgi:hypothetical protein